MPDCIANQAKAVADPIWEMSDQSIVHVARYHGSREENRYPYRRARGLKVMVTTHLTLNPAGSKSVNNKS